MPNLHKLYYRDYFKEVSYAELKSEQLGERQDKDAEERDKQSVMRVNQQLLNATLDQQLLNEESDPIANLVVKDDKFKCKVLYPGLVTGVGITHESNIEGEYKLGIHLDYTTGMPVVYGSTVKGVLRSYFNDFYKGTQQQKDALVKNIFECEDRSSYSRDIFFDAVVVIKDNKQRKLLAADSITPHGDNPLRDPVPIPFLKIAPGCVIQFRFSLVDSVVKVGEDVITMKKEQKLDLFKEILTSVGVGAKTNVGYGQLEEC